MEQKITKQYLRNNPYHVFVFGDNLLRIGKGGAASLRDEPNTYGFITKKKPNNKDNSFYKPDEYQEIFDIELYALKEIIQDHSHYLFLISKLGGGLANRYNIFEKIIQPGLQELKQFNNVQFLF